MSINSFERHNHSRCVATSMKTVEQHCADQALKFTPLRRRVLEILLQNHKAMGAYDVLAELDKGSQPPSAYRALDFLVQHGFAHKIEGLNAYIACATPGAEHSPAFMICRSCDLVSEATTGAPLGTEAAQAGFVVEQATIELQGLCPNCAEAPA